MIQKTYKCRVCGSTNIVKNGTNRLKQQHHCKDCGARRVLESKRDVKKSQKPIILSAYQERISLRSLSRVFNVHRQSISRWIVEHVKNLPKVKDTLLPAQPEDILEYDEAWSFVLKKINKRWLWTVLCRRSRQIIAFVIGDRCDWQPQ